MRTLIAGVGYSNLSDSSIGPIAAAELKKHAWPSHINIDDLSYGPIAAVHNFAEVEPRYERLVLITAADFGARPPAMRWDPWPAALPNAEEVQARVVEATSGVIDWKNLLVVLQQFEVLPSEVFVIAVQPLNTDFGMELSPGMQKLMPEILRLARKLAIDGKPDAVEFGVGQHVQT
jgi:hydrogenase maturation protease